MLRRNDDNTELEKGLMAQKNLYVTCQIADDLPYLLPYTGIDNLVVGTDYGHLDLGADLSAHRILAERTDVEPAVMEKILDTNGRQLLGLASAIAS
jgi:predicted TIM-barrel fold metal-dependent hydrolase